MNETSRARGPKRPTGLDARAGRRAARRFGLITRSEARALGFTPRMIDYRVKTGRWRRLAPGIYALAGAPETFEQRALAACLASGPGAMVSHRSAGALWGMAGCESAKRPDQPIEVVVPHGRGRRHNALATVHRSRRLTAADRTVRGGLVMTTPARTLIDLAGALPARSESHRPAVTVSDDLLSEQIDDAIAQQRVTLDRLQRRAAVVCGRGRGGTRRLRAVLVAWSTSTAFGSPPEVRLQRWMDAEGLGGVAQHPVVVDGDRFVFDRAWPAVRLGLEVDSYRWHGSPARQRRTSRRTACLRAAGWDVHSITPEQVDRRDPNVVRALRLALARASPPPAA